MRKMTIEEKVNKVKSLIIEINDLDYFPNQDDIRNITHYSLYQDTENFLFGLLQSEDFFRGAKFKEIIQALSNEEDIEIKKFNYQTFLKDAYFTKYFISVDTHIRHIASFYENSEGDIYQTSIKKIFDNLTDVNKITLFASLSSEDKKIFKFFCFLRNTMHNIGFQSKNKAKQTLVVHDTESVIKTDRTVLKLETGKPNDISLEHLLLLNEQIFKLTQKINDLIPQSDFIKHKLVESGFND